MRIFIWCLVIFFFVNTDIDAQDRSIKTLPDGTSAITHFCAQPGVQRRLLKNNPGLIKSAIKARQKLKQRAAQMASDQLEKGAQEEYIIPVVFHVIHDNGSENISYDQIENAVEVMTRDYHMQNPDNAAVISEFSDLSANVGITFKLAQFDPDGNCTNGVVRVKDQATHEGGENLKEISPIWDRSSYLNIWVAKSLENGAAGYSYKPPVVDGFGGESYDGIVVQADYVGAIGTSNPSLSHTLSHEAGHWLNLDHTWGGSNEPGEPGNCAIDDGIADTPNTLGHNTCNLSAETCGSLDNVQNFMEYSYCSNMFTAGQKSVLLAAATSSVADRSSLWSQDNLEDTGVLMGPVLCQANFIANARTVCAGDTVSFEDQSYSGVTTWNWTFIGGTPQTSADSAPQIAFESPGMYSVTLQVGNGTNTVATTEQDFIKVLPQHGEPLPYSEDFEEVIQLPNENWFLDSRNNEITWEIMNAGASGNKSIGIDNYDKPPDQKERITSNVVAIPDDAEVLYISYKVAYAKVSSSDNDRLRVFSSDDCGDIWTLREQVSASNLATVDPQVVESFVPENDDQWMTRVIDNTPDFLFSDQFRLMFEFNSDNGNNIYIDDVNIALEDVSGRKDPRQVALKLYPNPSITQSQLSFTLYQKAEADIAVYDLAGRRVQKLSRGTLGAGLHRITIETQNLERGMYVIRMNGEQFEGAEKLIVN